MRRVCSSFWKILHAGSFFGRAMSGRSMRSRSRSAEDKPRNIPRFLLESCWNEFHCWRPGAIIDGDDGKIENFNDRLSGERDTVSPMEQNLMNVSDRKHHRSLFLWSLGGFVIAASIRCVDILPDSFRRLHVAVTGGVGESAVWDEPLFYMAILGIPAGLIGALIAFAIAFAVRRRTKSK